MGFKQRKRIAIFFLAVLVAVAGVLVWRDQGRKNHLVINAAATQSAVGTKSIGQNSIQGSVAKNPPAGVATALRKPNTSASKVDLKNKPVAAVGLMAVQTGAPVILNRLVNWGFTQTNGRQIDTIIIHSSYNATGGDPHSVDAIINNEYKPNGVSPHYIIGRDGTIYRLVPDEDIAYHAGASKMPDGRTNVNNFSIGIEIVETMSESPSAAQYAALNSLINYLVGKYPIKHILGHSDIAPGRKTDPWNFDWGKITQGKEE